MACKNFITTAATQVLSADTVSSGVHTEK